MRLPYGSRRTAFLLFLGVGFLLAATSKGVLIEESDHHLFTMTSQLAEDGDIRRVPDDTPEDGLRDGIGLPLVVTPVYWVGDRVFDWFIPLDTQRGADDAVVGSEQVYLSTLTNAVIGGAVVAVTFLLALALGYRRATALVVALLLATGTTFAHEALLLRAEPLLALALVVSVVAIVKAELASGEWRRATGAWFLLSGSAAAVVLITRPEAGLLLVPLSVWLIVQLRRAGRAGIARRSITRAGILWIAPLLTACAVIGWANWERFGSPLDFGGWEARGMLDESFAEGVYSLLLSPGRGMLTYNPPLLLAILGLGIFVGRRLGLGLTITAMLAIAVAVPAATGSWSASASWGPREIVPLLPLLVLPVGEIVEAGFNATARRARFVLFGVTSLTAIFGIAVTTLGVVVPYDRYGAEYTASTSAFHRAVIDPDDAPLRVHVERFADDIDTPDLAARRYDANWLWYAAVALAWFGLLCLVVVVLRTHRPPLEPVPPLRLPPAGWDAEPRC